MSEQEFRKIGRFIPPRPLSAREREEMELCKPEQWQPIETAPRDGTWILGYETFLDDHHPCQRIVYWSKDRGCWFDDEYDFAPTHWMPLPDPPSETKS